MSKQKKSQNSSNRNFKLIHQNLTISDINFRRHTIIGCTELTVLPLTNTGKLWKLPLNCKQCRILKVTVNGTHNSNFSYTDPTLSICPLDTKKRNLEYYDVCHHEAIQSCDSDCSASAGELIVKIPKDTYDSSGRYEGKPLKVMIEFSLEQPKGGVQFVIPPGSSPENMQHMHVFTYGWENSSRLWFPCVDSYTELCHWTISLTVPSNMTAVSCGDLTEQLLSTDGKKKTFHYSLSVPTTAPCIAFAVGCFEVHPDPVMQEVTHFCLPGLLPILKNTVQFVHEVFGFYEELLSTRFPHSSYKLVFVDQPYLEAASYSTLGVFSANLLHSSRIIDQVHITRRLIAYAIAKQYFGCYILPQLWNDWWLPCGVAGFITGLFCKKAFGSTEYQHWIMQEQHTVCQYEFDHTLPPLCGTLAALQVTPSSTSGATSAPPPSLHSTIHPHLIGGRELTVLVAKAHLVVRMIQLKIGHELLLQVFHKLLTLAQTAAQTTEFGHWHNLLISTGGFMKSIQTVSGKDLSHFMEQWVCRSGVPHFHASFSYVRKKNIVELRLKQEMLRGYGKFVGQVNVVVQEFDGCFFHNIQVEDSTTVHELPCHSKIRKSKKRKVPLSHGEEVDVDISSLDLEVPVLWIRVDPEYQWLRRLNMEQADTIWQCMLRYERDATAQLEAIEALEGFPSATTRDILRDSVFDPNFYYCVRVQAARTLTKLLTGTGGSPAFAISIFQKLFGSQAAPAIVRYNDFSNLPAYFLQKVLPVCIAGIRNSHHQCPREVTVFLSDLFKYSDNQVNKFSDGYYISALIDALAKTITPKITVTTPPVGVDFSKIPTAALSPEAQIILQEIVQHLNIEKVLPSYHNAITASCLNALRMLQKNGHLPSESSLFREYAGANNFVHVRVAAIKAIVDIVQAEHSESDLKFLLDLVESDEPTIRLAVLNMLAASPPFTRRTESRLNTVELVERLWKLINSKFSHDSRLRNATVELYSALYGRLTPTCVPQGLGVVIDLKEKVARSSLSSPSLSPKVASTPEDGKSKHPLLTLSTGIKIEPASALLQTSSIAQATPQQQPALVKVRVIPSEPSTEPSLPPAVAPLPKSQPPLSLKISTSHLKRLSSSLAEGLEGSSVTPSPESALSGVLSDDDASPYPPRAKKHKAEHKHKKKKHKNKHKRKHKHSRDTDASPSAEKGDVL